MIENVLEGIVQSAACTAGNHQRPSHGQPLRGDSGFTLVEMLVVLSIIALVGALVGPQVLKYVGTARSETAKVQIGHIAEALELYYLDVGRYPGPQDGLRALVNAPSGTARWRGPYLKKAEAINDPWGQPYVYRFPGEHGAFDVVSLGRDNAAGGDGENRDVVSW